MDPEKAQRDPGSRGSDVNEQTVFFSYLLFVVVMISVNKDGI